MFENNNCGGLEFIIKRKDKHMFIKKLNLTILFALTVFTIIFINGCKDSSVVDPNQSNLSMSTISVAEPLAGDNSTLVLNEVKVMIKELEIETKDDDDEGEDEEIEIGPFVLYLDMSSQITEIIPSAYVKTGTYNKVKFKVHKLSSDEPVLDPDFVDNQGRYSVVIKGIYNGVPFVYKSKISAEQKTYLQSPLITSLSDQNLTLRVSPYLWFIRNGVYLDPMDPEDADEIDKNIKNNIKGEFKCYRDNDRNGDPD
jgi:hypothetical protein